MKSVRNYVQQQLITLTMWLWLPLFAIAVTSCDDGPEGPEVLPSDIKVTNAALQPSYTIPDDGTITVPGNGFCQGDGISLTDSLQQRYDAVVRDVTAEGITFGFDTTFPQKGEYTVRLHRKDDSLVLGNTGIELVCDFGVENIVLENKISVIAGKPLRVTGEGFRQDDALHFSRYTANKDNTVTEVETFTATTVSADATGITVTLPDEMPLTGDYIVRIQRAGRKVQIGTANIKLLADTEIEAKAGSTIMGTVYCGIKPVAGVVVSDGVNLTRTDDNGHYWLNSEKKLGTVFISVPSGYTPPVYKGTNTPHHYALLASPASTVEQHDFELVTENQHNFILMGLADQHLANRNADVSQFQSGFINDINAKIAEFKNEGKPVYCMTLGDLSWDTYWYTNSYNFANAIKELYKVNCPVYNCMGNHDNDLNITEDFKATHLYREHAGPTYYSINIGDTHIIVLDNIVYGAIPGQVGAASCQYYFDDVQWEWLKKDLATVTDRNKPLMLCMHHAVFRYPGLDADGNQLSYIGLDNNAGVNLVNLLADFKNVKLVTGHTHVNYDGTANNGTLHEQNVASVCGTWWWTGKNDFAQNNICRDGVPGGYGIFEFTGDRYIYQYKGIGYPVDYQFRAIDLNQVHITMERYAPNYAKHGTPAQEEEWTGGYSRINQGNEVLIDVFNYGAGWTLTVEEEATTGKRTLPVKRVMAKDPVHVISYQMPFLNRGNATTPTSGFVTVNSTKMFKVTASTPTSTLIIKATDPYGKVYTQRMERPKAFHAHMK